jgi:hypothetical protein
MSAVSELENCYSELKSQKSIKILASSSKNTFESQNTNDSIRIVPSRFGKARIRRNSARSGESDHSHHILESKPMTSREFLRQLETPKNPEMNTYILKRLIMSYESQPMSEADQNYKIYLKKIKALN